MTVVYADVLKIRICKEKCEVQGKAIKDTIVCKHFSEHIGFKI